MKRKQILLVAVMLSGQICAEPKKTAKPGTSWVVDKIVARVNGVNILKSDLEKPQIGKEGELYSLTEYIGEELLFQRAQEKHLLPSAADVERQIVSFKIQLKLEDATNEAFETHLKEYGFTLNSYKKQLGRLLAVNNTKQAEFSEKALITSREVEEAYKANPIYIKDKYHLCMAVLPDDRVENYKELLKNDQLTWKDFGFLEIEELDPRYEVATTLAVGEVTPPIDAQGRHVVLKLIAKQEGRQKTLDESYGDIERILQAEKRANFAQHFQQELLNKAFITIP